MQILILAAIVIGLLAFGKLLYVLWHSGGGVSVRLLEDEPPLSSWSLAKIVEDDEALYGYAPRSFAKPAAKGIENRRRKELDAVIQFPPRKVS